MITGVAADSLGVNRVENDSRCGACGCAEPAVDDADSRSGWRWYSNGRGDLIVMCASCATTSVEPNLAQAHDVGQAPEARGPMLYLHGCPIAFEDGQWLVARLRRNGDADGINAAFSIAKGFEQDLWSVELTNVQWATVLRHLDEPPDGLADLRRALTRDRLGILPLS